MRIRGSNTVIILSVFAASLLVRIAVFLQFRGTVYFRAPIMDAAFYHDSASGFVMRGEFGASLFRMSPLYQVFLSGAYSVFGISLPAIYMIQILAGSLSAVLLYMIAERLFNRTTAIVASVLYLLYGGFSVYNLVLLPLSIIILLNLAMVLLLLVAKERNSRLYYLLAGVVFALSVMARANVLLFLVFLVPWFYIYRGGLKRNSLHLACFILGMLVAFMPFSALHQRTEGLLSPLTSNMGINLYLGNNPDADGIQYIPSPELNSPEKIFEYARTTAEYRTGRHLGVYEVSDFWAREAAAFMTSRPSESASLFLRKLLLFWNDYEVPNNYNYYFLKQKVPVLRLLLVSFALIGSLALMGMVMNLRRWRDLYLVYGAVLAYNVSLVAFFVLSRYRMPAVPFLIMFSAGMLHHIATHRSLVKRAALICVFVVLFLLLQVRITEQDLSAAHVNLGIIYRNQGRYDLATEALQTAIEVDPDDATAYYNLAVVYLDLEDYDPAKTNLEAALSLEPNYRKALNGLGTVRARTGDHAGAEVLFLRVLELNPRDVEAMNNLGVLYASRGDYRRAEQRFRSVLSIEPDNEAARENLRHLNELKSR